jgi:hypothetical protein
VSVVGLAKAAARPVVQGWASEPRPAGAVVPSLIALNNIDPAAVTAAIRAAAARAGVKGRRVALVIPDLAAKVSLVPFETVPERREELAQLIAWQVRKAAPFQIEDAQLSFPEGYFFLHALYGLTWVDVGRRQPVAERAEALREARWALDRLDTPEGRAPYEAYYGAIDPVIPMLAGMRPGEAAVTSIVWDARFHNGDEFYNDYFLKIGLLDSIGASLIRDDEDALLQSTQDARRELDELFDADSGTGVLNEIADATRKDMASVDEEE